MPDASFQMVATFFVLLLFLSETTALYANLARAAIQRRGARHARQIAMDAMAASIGHEISQPLTAMLANAEAGMRQLAKAEPDLNEVHATFAGYCRRRPADKRHHRRRPDDVQGKRPRPATA